MRLGLVIAGLLVTTPAAAKGLMIKPSWTPHITLPRTLSLSDLRHPVRPMDTTKHAFLDALAGPESGGDYTVKNGGAHFQRFTAFPEGVGRKGTSTASGKYQFISGSWRMIAPLVGAHDFSPINQDRAAWYYADQTYKLNAHRDLENDLRRGDHRHEIATALRGVWPSIKADNLPASRISHYGKIRPSIILPRHRR